MPKVNDERQEQSDDRPGNDGGDGNETYDDGADRQRVERRGEHQQRADEQRNERQRRIDRHAHRRGDQRQLDAKAGKRCRARWRERPSDDEVEARHCRERAADAQRARQRRPTMIR